MSNDILAAFKLEIVTFINAAEPRLMATDVEVHHLSPDGTTMAVFYRHGPLELPTTELRGVIVDLRWAGDGIAVYIHYGKLEDHLPRGQRRSAEVSIEPFRITTTAEPKRIYLVTTRDYNECKKFCPYTGDPQPVLEWVLNKCGVWLTARLPFKSA